MNRDISNWGWGQILELPDHLFGRRSVVAANIGTEGVGEYFDISECGLPEKFVIWDMCASLATTSSSPGEFRLALGDHLPANAAEFIAMETLLPDVGILQNGVRLMAVTLRQGFDIRNLKIGVDSSGRRLVSNFVTPTTAVNHFFVRLVISSVPRSIPEWYG